MKRQASSAWQELESLVAQGLSRVPQAKASSLMTVPVACYLTCFLCALQLVQMKRQASSAWQELESLVAQGLSRVPQLKAYARQPYTTWVLYGILGFPFAILALPLLLATGALSEALWLLWPEQLSTKKEPEQSASAECACTTTLHHLVAGRHSELSLCTAGPASAACHRCAL